MNSIRSSSIMIPIPKTNSYSINNNIFDPINNSPPNEFILKLNLRSTIYDNNNNNNHSENYLEYLNYRKKETKETNLYLPRIYTSNFNIPSSLEKK
jgi:hypothetical protein